MGAAFPEPADFQLRWYTLPSQAFVWTKRCPDTFFRLYCITHMLMMHHHIFSCCLSALAFTRSSPCGPKWLIYVFFIPPRSTSRDPLSHGMPIRSRRTSHIQMISRHVLSCCLTCLTLTRSPLCGPKWPFCVFFIPPRSTSRDPLSHGMPICSRRTPHT